MGRNCAQYKTQYSAQYRRVRAEQMSDIHRAGTRAKLAPRREPYWRHLEGTGYIGYRKMPSGVETWQARWRGDDGKPLQKSLGKVSKANDFTAASTAARSWFGQRGQGVPKAGTVEEACKAYVKNLAKEKPEAPQGWVRYFVREEVVALQE